MDDDCPLCITPLAPEEKSFRPCPCGFRMCVWCWHKMFEHAEIEEARCPNCREYFDKAAVLAQRPQAHRKPPKSKAVPGKASIADVVVEDRRLMAVLHLPDDVFAPSPKAPQQTPADVLRQHPYFGQYGRILDMLVFAAQRCCAVRYSSPEEAAAAVAGAHGVRLRGSVLHAALIPTRYCSAWLRNQPCKKPRCVDLHYEVDRKMYASGKTAELETNGLTIMQSVRAALKAGKASPPLAAQEAPTHNGGKSLPPPVVPVPLPRHVKEQQQQQQQQQTESPLSRPPIASALI
jgi:hypothetical protein